MALTPMSGGPAFAPKMPLRRQWLGRGQTGGINPRLDMEQMGAQDAEPLTYQGEPVDPRRMLSKPMPGGAPMSSLLDAYKQASGGGNTIGLPLMPPVGSGGGMQVKPMPGMGVSAPAPAPGGTTFQSSGLGADELEEIKAKYAQQTGQQPPAGSDPPVMEPGAQFTGSKQPPQVMPGQPVKPPVEVDNIPPMIASAIAKGDPGTSIKEAMGATDDLKFDASKPMPTRYPSQMGVGVNDALRMDPSKPMPMPGRYPPQMSDQGMNGMGPDSLGGRGMGRGRGGWGGGMSQAWPDIMGGGGNPAYLGGLRGLLGGIGGNAPGGFDPNKPITPYGGYGDPTGRGAYLARGGRTGWEPKGGPGDMRAMPMPMRIGPAAQPNKPMMRRPARPKPAGWGRGGGSSGSASSRKIGAP